MHKRKKPYGGYLAYFVTTVVINEWMICFRIVIDGTGAFILCLMFDLKFPDCLKQDHFCRFTNA